MAPMHNSPTATCAEALLYHICNHQQLKGLLLFPTVKGLLSGRILLGVPNTGVLVRKVQYCRGSTSSWKLPLVCFRVATTQL